MTRVPARVVLQLLHQHADWTGDDRYRITPAALRKWVQRGHITRGPGGYDLAEIVDYLDRRDHEATTGRNRTRVSLDSRSAAVSR